jgi:hypothetical protein
VKVKTEFIKVNELHVDPDAQRSLRPSWRDYLAANYDETKLGIFHVSPNGNGYRIIDGQHRTEMLRKLGLGEKKVRCLVYTGLSQQDEAGMFLGLNNNLKVRAYDKFRVRVTEGEPVATAIMEIIGEVGLTLADQKTDGAVRAVNQLEAVYTGRSLRLKEGPYPDHLRWTLSILKDAWGYNANAFDGVVIEGLGAVILRFGDRIDRDRFGKKIAGFPGGPVGLQAKAKAWKDLKETTLKNAMAEILVEVYNNQLRSSRLPAWDRA